MENITAVITQEDAKISCNFEQVEQAIRETLAEYKGAVFTEDSKSYAKKHIASLRAQKKELQDRLREEKKKYMKPWDAFEPRAKQLIALYDEPINLISGQVQAFEEERTARKKKRIAEIYAEAVPEELCKVLPLERLYNSRWENATFKEKDIRAELEAAAERAGQDISTIKSMESDTVPEALELYCRNLDLSAAVAYVNDYERKKREILAAEQERRRREEEARVRREEREKLLAEQRAREAQEEALRKAEQEKQEALRKAELEKEEAARRAEEEKTAAVEQAKKESAQEVFENLIPDLEGEAELYEYRISLSEDAKEKLEMYMDSVGIEWEMIGWRE